MAIRQVGPVAHCRQARFGTSVNCRSPVSCGSPLTSRLERACGYVTLCDACDATLRG